MKLKFTLITIAFAYILNAQIQPISTKGGSIETPKVECVPQNVRTLVNEEVNKNIENLGLNKKSLNTRNVDVTFEWPLRLAAGRPNQPYYVIGNLVDLNPALSNQITDYNCGTKSYDNHTGIDIGITPFGWLKMDNNDVEVIAAAAGTIVARREGDFDRNCGASATMGNFIAIQHSDGTKAYYYHMKNGSITSKTVGSTVIVGEYLGVVGSSGNSSGPHLHFEVQSSTGAIIDPFAGTCNNIASRWVTQLPYYEPTIHMVSTHANQQGPLFPICPATEIPRIKTNFSSGDLVDFFSYYHDQQNGHTVALKIFRPNNTLYTQWTYNFNAYIQVSLWASSFFLPNPAPSGTWRFEATYQGQTVSSNFTVNVALPVELLNFNVHPKQKKVDLTWETLTETNNHIFIIEKSENGGDFKEIGSVKGKGNSTVKNGYSFSDNNSSTIAYYRLKQVDFDEKFTYSHTLSVVRKDFEKLVATPNPSTGNMLISNLDAHKKVEIFDILGRLVLSFNVEKEDLNIDLSSLQIGTYFIKNGFETIKIAKF
jgi:murein DD-endopeptidase MepM/ murein hydrolase activator NlpD